VGSAQLVDLYELTMAASYLRRDMTEMATFSLFVRRLPPGRGFLVAAGLDDALGLLESFSFGDDDLGWLAARGFTPEDLERFAGLRFTGDVWAVREGELVFADEPLLEVTAPLPEAQLVETILLNQLTYQTALTTKAARCRLATAGRAALVDFSFRRTQGIEAGMRAARAAAIADFAGTSNVAAAMDLGWVAVGTMAHSYIEAFPDERTAFRAFARDFPDRATFLVDTYDTLDGVAAALDVADELGLEGAFGVRLDSGDLLELSLAARELLDGAGRTDALIVASGGLDEFEVARLLDAGAPIDVFGVGTRIGVSADAPSLDSAYKLVEYAGRPVMKLSPGKETLPFPKQVHRRDLHHPDVIALRDDPRPPSGRPLLVPVMRGGQRTVAPEPIAQIRARLVAAIESLPASMAKLDAEPPTPTVSPALRDATDSLAESHRGTSRSEGQ
jgi:nicotinate phosphoribosyltransferase